MTSVDTRNDFNVALIGFQRRFSSITAVQRLVFTLNNRGRSQTLLLFIHPIRALIASISSLTLHRYYVLG